MVETIYALGSSMTTLVKIGYTAGSIERRMQSLQCGHPVELIIRAQVDVAGYGEQIEQAIHALLEPQRRTGEWFEVSMDQQTLEGLVRQAGGICAERRAQAATSIAQDSLRTPPTPVSTPFDYPALAGKVGYARVSTVGQSVAIQLERLRATGCHKIFEEKASGVNAARPRLNACLEYLREGDTLVVTRIDRLARSILHLCQIGALLAHKGVHLLVLEQAIDTSSSSGELYFHMLGAIAQFENRLRHERQMEGIAAAKVRGVRFGRVPGLTPAQIVEVQQRRARGVLIKTLMQDYRLSKSALYRYLAAAPHGQAPDAEAAD